MYNEIFRVISGFPRYISCYIAENRFHLGQCRSYLARKENQKLKILFDFTEKNMAIIHMQG